MGNAQARPALTPKVQQEMEEIWALRRDAVRILGVVAAEWKTDPHSVRCFDDRLVARGIEISARLEALELQCPFA